MDPLVHQLEELAAGAVAHARFAHDTVLRKGDFTTADRILTAERHAAQDAEHEMLAACYGAWIGDWAAKVLAASWTGLSEPLAPRIVVGGMLCSPIDALKRFLVGGEPCAPAAWMMNQMQGWAAACKVAQDAHLHNQIAWNQLADDDRFAGDIELPQDAPSALAALDPWLKAIWTPGCRLLCLGAGGGRQGPLHAIAGAEVTVVDFSQRQLDHDRRVATRLGLSLSLVCCSAERMTGVEANAFDVVVQPVSACYMSNVRLLYAEVARVLRPGGIYLVQHKQPLSMRLKPNESSGYQLDEPAVEQRSLPVISAQQRPQALGREPGVIEYGHSLQTLIGELCSAGFLIEKFAEPPRADAFAPHGTAEHQACFAPPYFKIQAISRGSRNHS